MVETLHEGKSRATDLRARRLSQRRKAILEAAARIFGERSYERATLQEIGEAVGLSKTSLYYYVESKEDLLGQLLAEVIDVIAARAQDGFAPDGSGEDRLRNLLHAHVEVVCRDSTGILLARHQDVVLGEAQSVTLRKARRRHERSLELILEQGRRACSFGDVDARVIAFLILGALNGIARWAGHVPGVTPQDIAETLHSMVVSGIRAAGAPAKGGKVTRAS